MAQQLILSSSCNSAGAGSAVVNKFNRWTGPWASRPHPLQRHQGALLVLQSQSCFLPLQMHRAFQGWVPLMGMLCGAVYTWHELWDGKKSRGSMCSAAFLPVSFPPISPILYLYCMIALLLGNCTAPNPPAPFQASEVAEGQPLCFDGLTIKRSFPWEWSDMACQQEKE